MPSLDALISDPKRAPAFFWLVTALGALLLLGGAVLPLAGLWGDLSTAIAAEQRRAEAQARVLARAESIAAERDQLMALGPASADLLTGATDALAAAELQTLLAQAALQSGARLISTQSLPAETQEGFRRVGVRMTVSAGARQMRDLLYGLEAGYPRLVVGALTMRSADPAGGRIDISLDVHGWRAAPADPG